MQKTANLEAAAKKLIDTANANGGDDNVTVILAQYQPN
jgi:serine/threonine protein phosphatase PrpC